VAHGTVRCAHRQTASPTVGFVVGAINTPNHHHSKYPSFSDISFNTRASAINTRHNSKESKLLQVPIHSKLLVARERVLLVSFELLFLDRFLLPILVLQALVI
jgi:hypothetical protein